MIVYEEKSFEDVYNLLDICWGGAIQRLEEVKELSEDAQDEFIQYIKDNLDDGEMLTTTQLNDFIWFECDKLIAKLQREEEEDN